MNTEIVVKDYERLSVSVSDELIGRIRDALSLGETIFEISDPSGQSKAVAVQAKLKELISGVNRAREAAKAPVLELGRKIDALAKTTVAELESEHRRIAGYVESYQREQRELAAAAERERQEALRKIEEENRKKLWEAGEAQRKIEAEQRAEQARIDAALAKAKSEARRAQLLQEQAKHEARVKAEAEAAKKSREDMEQAALTAVASVGPKVEVEKAKGQVVRTEIEVIVRDIHALYRERPNAVTLEPRIAFLKELYEEGQRNIKGVEFREKIISTTRTSKSIDV